jgi:hypothetical protein
MTLSIMALGAMTLSIMTLGDMTLSITALDISTLSIMTLGAKTLSLMTLCASHHLAVVPQTSAKDQFCCNECNGNLNVFIYCLRGTLCLKVTLENQTTESYKNEVDTTYGSLIFTPDYSAKCLSSQNVYKLQ